MILRGVVAAMAALMIVGAAGCTATSAQTETEPIVAAWQEINLPPAPTGSVNSVRAFAACAGHWYATGALLTSGADPRPAAWSSPDGRIWTAIEVAPNTYYGERNIVYAAACYGDRLVAIGAKAGGAHGNPRTSTWYTDSAGVLVEVEARPYTLFGGENAVNTSRIAAGPLGWILTGNRVSGAAAWLSATGERFEIIERAAGLAHGGGVFTYASDVIAVDGGWLIVGARTQEAANRDPAAWTSPDGRSWQPQSVPASADYEEMQRAVARADTIVAVGPRGARFGAWRRIGVGEWEAAGSFGGVVGTVPGSALALATVPAGHVAITWNGLKYEIWLSGDLGTTWRAVMLPAPSPSGPTASAALTSDGRQVLLALDDGAGSRLWSWRATGSD